MKNSNSKKSRSSRREFLTTVGLGAVSIATLSSCEVSDLNFIGKLKGTDKRPPSERDIDKLVEAANLVENIEKTVSRMKKAVATTKIQSEELDQLFSDAEVKKLIAEETQFYMNFYQTNFTSNEIKELVKVLNSKVWKKYMQKTAELNTKPQESDNKPSNKFVAKVNAVLMKGNRGNKAS